MRSHKGHTCACVHTLIHKLACTHVSGAGGAGASDAELAEGGSAQERGKASNCVCGLLRAGICSRCPVGICRGGG